MNQANLISTLFEEGKYSQARLECQTALKSRPKDVNLLNSMAMIDYKLGHADSALKWITQAIELAPQNLQLKINQAAIYIRMGHLSEAIHACKFALKIDSNSVQAFSNLGEAYRKAGQLEEAAQAYQDALQRDAHNPHLLANLAVVYKNQGLFTKASQFYERAIKIQPTFARAYWSIAHVSRATADNNHIEQIKHLLQQPKITLSDQIYYHYALAKEYEDVRDTNRSFNHLIKANQLKRSSFEYDIKQDADYFKNVKTIFNERFLSRCGGSGDQSNAPIFILGMPRSGTTLVEQILSAHSDVATGGELKTLGLLIWHKMQHLGNYPECVLQFSKQDFKKMGQDYVQGTAPYANNKERIIDKMPHNFLHIGLIHCILPNATIICLNRHPYEVCLSNFKQLYASGHHYSYSLKELGQYYNFYDDIMAHWRQVLPKRIIDVAYEDLVTEPEATLRQLLVACGLKWDDACLKHSTHPSAIRTASSVQAKQAIYQSSIESWKPYEKYLSSLFDALKQKTP